MLVYFGLNLSPFYTLLWFSVSVLRCCWLEGYNPNRPRICSPKQPGQIHARPRKWGQGTVQKIPSRESWSDLSGDRSCVEWEQVGENGISCFLPCILLLYIEWICTNYCKLSRNFVGAIRTTTINCRVSFIYLYLVFPRNFGMVFLPHTNTVILLEPYCGTITEPGLNLVLLIYCYFCYVFWFVC